jgi:hypothetical protein
LLIELLLSAKQQKTRERGFMDKTPPPEEALLLKDLGNGRLVIERQNGEQWLLDAKRGWCPWSWMYEGRKVALWFGPWSCRLMSAEGDTCDFWTEEQVL